MNDLIPFDVNGSGARFGRDDDGTVWAVGSDFAKRMGYRDARDAARLLDDADRGTRNVRTPGGDQNVTVFFEDGIWELIFRSTLPGAKAIKARVKAILREIRETGSYNVRQLPQTYAEALRELAGEVEARAVAEAKVAELEPAARSWDELAGSHGDYSLRDAAQILDRDPAITTGQNRLMRSLRDFGWVDRTGKPYQRHVDRNLLCQRTTSYTHPHTGESQLSSQIRITVKGVHELHKLLGGTGALLLDLGGAA